MADLTDRQRLFVDGVLAGKSQSEAYRDAGYKVARGNSADSAASHLLSRNVKVREALAEARAAVQKRTRASVEWVIEGLCDEAEYRGEGSTHSARVRARELVGKHLGLFVDRAEITTTTNVNVNITDDQRREAILRIVSAVGDAGDRPADSGEAAAG